MNIRKFNLNKNKEIYLFGAGKTALKFYNKYNHLLNIKGCISNEPNGDFNGLPVIKPENKKDSSKFIIICSVWENDILKQLQDLNYIVMEDFSNVYWFDFFYNLPINDLDKEIALFYGTCHINSIMNALRCVTEFNKKYLSICIRVNAKNIIDIIIVNFLLFQCSLILYEKYIGNPVDKVLNNISAKIISIPQFKFWAYWPQANINGDYNIYFNNILNNIVLLQYNDNLIYKEDKYINNMIELNKSEDEILSFLYSDDIISKNQILQELDKNIKNIKITERFTSIKISDYIVNSYNKERVFKDYIHLNECLMKEYMVRILEFLEIKSFEFLCDNEENLYPFTEMPIYPCVAKHLGLEMINTNSLYSIKIDNETYYKLNFEDYEKEYIRRCKEIKSLL